jgi:hypothetical protein
MRLSHILRNIKKGQTKFIDYIATYVKNLNSKNEGISSSFIGYAFDDD